MPRVDLPEFVSAAREVPFPISSDSLNDSGSDTLIGKLKVLCPSLFNTLTTWENLTLDASSLPGTESVSPPCDPTPASLLVSMSLEYHLTSRLGYAPLRDLSLTSGVFKPAHDLVRAHSTCSEPRVSLSVFVNHSMDVGSTFPNSHATKWITGMGVDLGGTDPYLLSSYLEAILGECSLREMLESLVHPTQEANTSVSLTTYQGNCILPLPDFTDLVNLYELLCGGVGSSYAWSKGMGFETSPIKTRSA